MLGGTTGKCIYLIHDFLQEDIAGREASPMHYLQQPVESKNISIFIHGFHNTIRVKNHLIFMFEFKRVS